VGFVPASAYMLYYVYGFMYVEPSSHPWNEINLFTVYELFDLLLNSVCRYFVENLCLYSLKILEYNSVLVVFLLGFEMIVGLGISLVVFILFLFSGKDR
jgi:hypothetical protein